MPSVEELRILVVDDEPGMRSSVSRALEGFRLDALETKTHLRFRTEEAGSGEEALERMEASPPDVILLDHKLPGISGMEILERVEGSERDFLVIVITAYASLEMAVRATKQGAYDLLAKPFTPDELRATVGKAAKHLVLQRSARALAEERRQVRFRFLSVLAHELKAPLAAVQSYLNLLKDWQVAEQPAEYARITGRCLLRIEGMRKLILDLLDLTRIESGHKQRRLEPVDLNRAAKESLEMFHSEAEKRNITMALHAQCPRRFWADRGEIEMILNNLVSNAVKYNRDGGSVDLEVAVLEDELRIAVKDTGIGMTPEEVSSLFGEFVRIKNEKTERILGSGLGLSVLQKIVALYKGRVDVESTPGEGSVFRVVLPEQIPETSPAAG